jgi:Spy/CpxP family protein refolding chaperone
MFGFVFGTLCLVAFFSVLRHRGWGHHGCHGRGFGRHGRFGLYRAFQELDTSPGQEKAIRAAVGELRQSLVELRPQLDAARSQVAGALRGDRFDAASVEASLERHTADLARHGAALSNALGKVHEALDPDQRRRLARLIETGPGYPCV